MYNLVGVNNHHQLSIFSHKAKRCPYSVDDVHVRGKIGAVLSNGDNPDLLVDDILLRSHKYISIYDRDDNHLPPVINRSIFIYTFMISTVISCIFLLMLKRCILD